VRAVRVAPVAAATILAWNGSIMLENNYNRTDVSRGRRGRTKKYSERSRDASSDLIR